MKTMRRQTADQIDAAAADWAARLDRAPLSAEEQQALDRWLGGDPRRLGAFMRMRAVALHSERAAALGPNFIPAPAESPALTRRRLLWYGGSGALAAGIAGTLGLGWVLRRQRFDTRVGEVRVVTLEDGSVMTLNTDSRVTVQYSPERRLVLLDRGEALFDVAKNAARPFIVEAGGTAVRAVGTSFTVKRLPDAPIEVLVREGVVEVTRPRSAAPVRMAANTRLRSATSPDAAEATPVAMTTDEVSRELAWRSGQIALEGETLAEAAQIFARYSSTRIEIDDPAVGREEITGLFAANDPVRFAEAAAISLNLKAEIGPEAIRLTRPR